MDELDVAVAIEREITELSTPLQVKHVLRAAIVLMPWTKHQLGAGSRKAEVVERLSQWVCQGPGESSRRVSEGHEDRLGQARAVIRGQYVVYAEELEQQAAKLRSLV